MATGDVKVDEGSGTNLATYTVTEDAETKEIPRAVLNKSDGTEVDPLTDTQLRASAVPVSLDAAGLAALELTGIKGADGAAIVANANPLPISDAGGSITVDGTVAVTGVATEATLDARTGSLTETAPTTDTASSGINGRLQRIAQRLTSLIALLPGSLGQKAMAASLAVTVASDQTAIPASQSGTWTVQPGNTANTTAWKVDGSAVTQPVSLASVPSHAVTNAGTFAVQAASAGDVAHDGVDSGNPVKTGGQARITLPTTVADGDRSNFITDKHGRQVVTESIRDLRVAQQTTITSSTAETTILSAVASTFLDVYGLVITNTSATTCKVTIKDATAGTTRFVFEVPATDTRGFMLPASGAHAQATVNNNWTATCASSVASIEITALAVKNT